MLCRVALVRTDVSEELSASFIRVKRIGELGTTLAVTSNRRSSVRRLLVTASVPPKRRFLQEAHGVTSQKTPFCIVTIVMVIWEMTSGCANGNDDCSDGNVSQCKSNGRTFPAVRNHMPLKFALTSPYTVSWLYLTDLWRQNHEMLRKIQGNFSYRSAIYFTQFCAGASLKKWKHSLVAYPPIFYTKTIPKIPVLLN
jgi:hypothetical protein